MPLVDLSYMDAIWPIFLILVFGLWGGYRLAEIAVFLYRTQTS